MSKMGLWGAIGFSLALVSLTQIPHSAEGCQIYSATPSGPSSILVKWEKSNMATSYFLDLRVKNDTNYAPVVVTPPATATEKDVQGLRPGTEYIVTLKIFQFYFVVCVNNTLAWTVPDTSQIEFGWAVSSTSIFLQWTDVPSADIYYLEVRSQDTGEKLNFNITGTSAVVRDLLPSTHYDCYIYTGNQAGLGRGSKVRTITTLEKPPLNVAAEQTGQFSARVTWLPVKDVLVYNCIIQNLEKPNDPPYVRNVTGTKLEVEGILPCSTYLISVSSFNSFLVLSEPTNFTYTTNKLSPVSSISVDYTCTSQSAMVQWSAVVGATSYKATAMGDHGTELTCTSQGTSCQITGLDCGQDYKVNVTPISENCKNTLNSTSATFQTVPCPPKKLDLSRDCSSEVIVFSWEPTNNTDHYLARAEDSKGEVMDCLTEDTACYFTQTVCGRHYFFTVYSIAGGCRSQISTTVDIRTAPCIPQNLQTSSDCKSDGLLSKWDLAEGALRYTLQAYGNTGHKDEYNCTTTSNSCVIPGINCGEYLTIYITAFDDECSSPRTLGPVAETLPCSPTNVKATKKCATNAITTTWATTRGAIFYVAIAEDSNGNTHHCNAINLMCTINDLKCSTNYTVRVIASNFKCNSSESEMLTIETAACPPDNVTASLDCKANEAMISWYGDSNLKSFTATIVDEDQGLLSCSSNTTACQIPNLKCGKRYTVNVLYHDGNCSSIPSNTIYLESVPCGPANMHANVSCASGGVTIDWDASSNAEGYLMVISDGSNNMSYNTSQTELSVSTLECGLEYTATVTSFTGTCVSFPSVLPVKEAPCVPTNVVTERNCGQTFLGVTWQTSRGAKTYTAAAVDKDGNRLECSSNATSCNLEGVMCGEVYNVSLVAVDDNCTSPGSPAVTRPTAPCPPSQLNVSVNCGRNSAALTWDSSPNAVSYTGKAVSEDGHSVSCDAGAALSCQLEGLNCGKKYTFTVSASDGDCHSHDSDPVIHTTAPCAVQNVLNALSCSNNTLSTSWTPGSMSLNYSVTAQPSNRSLIALRCITGDSSCTLSHLQCGVQYNVTVRALSSTCEGHSSVPQIVNSVPCVPANVRGVVDCSAHMLRASWDAECPTCAASYTSTLKGEGGFSTSCDTANGSCIFPGLQCAQTYTLSVVGVSDRCNSSTSAVVSATTAPCDPTNVKAALNCVSGVAVVTWGASAGASHYTVLAEANGHVDSCTSSNSTSCDLTQLQCGENYTVTVLAGDGKCNSSLLATTNITTAPCAPVIQHHSLDCVSNNASVTWVKDEDAAGVTVTAQSSLGHSTSCRSTNSSCVLDELRCGNIYTVKAVAQGVQCPSKPSSTFQIVTAPCTPANVGHSYSCPTNIAMLNWDEALGRDRFYAHVQSGNHTASCPSTQTHCTLPSLLCGRLYDVEVTAVAEHCNSSTPGVTQIQTAPCAPTNVSASLVCDNDTAAVRWNHGPGAVSYKVTAQGRDGDFKECTTNGTSCDLSHLHCAQTYSITVTPSSSQCKGFSSTPVNFIAGPCPPTTVNVALQCDGNVGLVTWSPVLQADHYEATALDDHEHNCSSTGTSCSLTDLQCGETSVVTVVTVERGCRSKPSTPVPLQSVICPPSNVTGVTSCTNSDITVSWKPSPESGVSYIVHSQEEGGVSANFSTTQTSHVITGLRCGELYNLTVAAKDSDCTSVFSEPIQTETAPCAPTNLTATAECGTNSGTLSWAPSTHAISYTATVTGTHGHVVSCSSNVTTCSVKLDCGHQYSASVVASSATCNSSAGQTFTFSSAPCLPDRVVAELDCKSNSFAVNWRGSIGDGGSYTAIAIGSDGTRATCDSTSTNCTIKNLTCGLTYSIVVTTPLVDCGTIEGSDYSVQSAACKPDNVTVDLQCSNNTASVRWGNSGPNQTQVVTAVDSRGGIRACNSTGSTCMFDQLTCGETYTISVVGHTNSCSSEPAVAQQLKTAPCVPTYLTAKGDCLTGITMVTWDSARGATSYKAYARGSLGHNAECSSTDTNCDLPNLACGQDYNITVVARHDSCTSLVSKSTNTTTGPCPHSALKTSLDCTTNTAIVSWTPGSGILYYKASAAAFNIAHEPTCSTSGNSCNITSLRCGERYKVSVSGEGKKCQSPGLDWHIINATPCPPTDLRVNSSCRSNDVVVSWQASQGSISYMASAVDAQGRQKSCNTSSTSCQIPSLLCGQQYQVYTVGFDGNCFGAKSNITVIRTAPCVPQNIQTNVHCRAGVLNVTWQSTGHFLRFRASVASSGSDVRTCTTDQHHCTVHNMQCDQTYDVTVLAEDEACNSSQSPMVQVLTAPCPLSSFLPTVNCSTGVVSVTWNNSTVGVEYTVSALSGTGRTHNCTGTNNHCDLSTLECGTKYNVTITPSRNGCVGGDSPTLEITTVPCVPKFSEVEIDCLTNTTWLIYKESAGAERYVSTVTDNLGDEETFECEVISEGLCAVPQLNCSKNLTVTLRAHDQQCSSPPSNAIIAETAPCTPQDVKNSLDCDNNTISISWSSIPGAVAYMATLEAMDGNTTCCTSSDTGCDITDLPCGEFYLLHVTAEGRTCNSSQSDVDITRTAPCVPQNLQGNVSCSNNVASMSWEHSKGGHLYRVTAVSASGHQDECTSSLNRCKLTGLRCGELYTATVTAEDIECRSKPSESVTIRAAPCTPANMSSVVHCEANALVVAWSESPGADSYIATVQDSSGQTTTCQATTEGYCNVTGLGCGQIYQVSVVSSNGYCNSPPTSVVKGAAGPCEPMNIRAVFDCYIEKASVVWSPSSGAQSYVVSAVSASGHVVTCHTNTTLCELEGLSCGQSYSVSVEAVGQNCSSIGHMTGHLVTGPCVPERIDTQYSLNIGQVLWDVSAGAGYYTVVGVTEQGLTVSCSTNESYCALNNLKCGQVYNISVTANNHVCRDVSVSTEEVEIVTEPCPPNNVQTSVNCQSNVGTVSWETSFGALSYTAKLAGRNGDSLSCSTTETSCSVENLHCGVIYHTEVIAAGPVRSSSPSTTVLLVAAPCAAEDLKADLDCDISTAEISWSPASVGSSYAVTAVTADGHRASCDTTGVQCELTELQCGQTYNVSLTTISDHCRTEAHSNVTFSTRPCKPLRVGVDTQCGTGMANFYWEEKEDVELYLATATCSMGTLKCNSTNSTCLFSDLQCGETYEFSVTAYGNMCSSETSSTAEIQTEPCQPTGLNISGTCYNDTVVLDWSAASGASMYVVTARGDLGYVTAFKTNETMIETELPCGQLFTFTVQSQDDRCDSSVSLSKEFKTEPCVPIDVRSFTRCEDSLGSVSWAPSDGAETYLAIATAEDGHTHMCVTNTSSCTFDDLHCGETYTVHVIANDYMCSSLPSNSTSIRMAPCVPQNLESSMNCTIKVGSVSWNASETAEFYIVTAETSSGHKVQLSTNNTWTFISEFQCGQEYFLSVQAVDSECTSQPSPPSVLKSEPCPPTDVSSFVNCVSNIAAVSWTGSAGAEYYYATVTPEDDQSKGCWSDSTQCGIPNLICGQNYTVAVIASRGDCHSDPSESQILQSVPCIPDDVDVAMDCSNNAAVVSWSASRGALSYMVTARSKQGHFSSCKTADLTCTLTNLTCGQTYMVRISAQDNVCSSLLSLDVEFMSAPCTPDIGTVILDCFSNSALLDWAFSEGAVEYTATARSSGGFISTCNTNNTNCELQNLRCGQIYNMIVVASNKNCTSPPSSRLQVESVPCPPEGVVAEVNCSTNTAQVDWQSSTGADSYIVQAFSMQGHESGCETTSQSCVLSELLCGCTYNITVRADNSVCNVSASSITQMKTVPCEPQQVEARVVCESGGVAVSWEPSKGALSYTTVAQGSGGYESTCNSSETTCLFSDLLCGLNYSISVSASDDVCSSAGSSEVEINTLPCAPEEVTAEVICSNDTGVVWWEEEDGVSSYRVQAFSPDGHRTECSSMEASCQLPSLHCGQLYNLTVTAQDGECDNRVTHSHLQSVPCTPTNVKASLLCHSNSAAVTWERASGAASYLAVAVSSDGTHQTQCNNTVTHCDLDELQCGQTYNVSVFAQDESCSSVESSRSSVQTAPCAPQNVTVNAQCADGAMTVSWSPNPDVQHFHVMAVSNTGARLYCNSSSTSCTMSNLPCGQHYNVTVLSVRDECESQPSAVVATSSAPCLPKNPKSHLDCVSNSAWVTWDDAEGALSYSVFAEELNGHNSSCTTTSSPCKVPDLKCGTHYTLHLTAMNEHCHSNHSSTFELVTGPCSLTSVSAATECSNNAILVEWENTLNTTLYVVTAEGHDQSLISCNSSYDSCVLEEARCGMHYSIIVSASSNRCSNLRSAPKKIETAPCPPDNVTVVQSCEENGVTVTWGHSPVAASYQLTATGSDGHVSVCNTTVNNCTLADLHCGQLYNLSITATGDNCTSMPSTSSFRSVPCQPSGLTVDMECETNSAVLSWEASEGAVNYYGCAQPQEGDALYCDSAALSCTFDNLECGKTYNFSVEASDGFCNSSFSAPLTEGAVPCPPTALNVRMQKIGQHHWALTSWDSVNCSDVEYLAEISGRIQDDPQALMDVSSYWLPRRYFEFPMPCSTAYNLTVRSRNSAGVSAPSAAFAGVTVPCPPQNVQYSGNAQSAVLSWDESVFASNYTVYDTSGGSRVRLCSTDTLSCPLTNFNSSATEVTASNTNGESRPNGVITGPVGSRRRRHVRDILNNGVEGSKVLFM